MLNYLGTLLILTFHNGAFYSTPSVHTYPVINMEVCEKISAGLRAQNIREKTGLHFQAVCVQGQK